MKRLDEEYDSGEQLGRDVAVKHIAKAITTNATVRIKEE